LPGMPRTRIESARPSGKLPRMRRGRPNSGRALSRSIHAKMPSLPRPGPDPPGTVRILQGRQVEDPEKTNPPDHSSRRRRPMPHLPKRRGSEELGQWIERGPRGYPEGPKASLFLEKGRGYLFGGSLNGLGSGPGDENPGSYNGRIYVGHDSSRHPERPGNVPARQGRPVSSRGAKREPDPGLPGGRPSGPGSAVFGSSADPETKKYLSPPRPMRLGSGTHERLSGSLETQRERRILSPLSRRQMRL